MFCNYVHAILHHLNHKTSSSAHALDLIEENLIRDFEESVLIGQPLIEQNKSLFHSSRSYLHFLQQLTSKNINIIKPTTLLEDCPSSCGAESELVDSLKQQLKELKKTYECNTKTKTQQMNDLNQKHKNDIEAQLEEIENYKSQLEDRENKLETCRSDLTTCRSELNTCRSELKTLTNEINENAHIITEYEEQIDNLNSTIKQTDEQLKLLNEKNEPDKYTKYINHLTQQIEDKHTLELDSLKQKHENAMEKCISENSALMEEIKILNRNYAQDLEQKDKLHQSELLYMRNEMGIVKRSIESEFQLCQNQMQLSLQGELQQQLEREKKQIETDVILTMNNNMRELNEKRLHLENEWRQKYLQNEEYRRIQFQEFLNNINNYFIQITSFMNQILRDPRQIMYLYNQQRHFQIQDNDQFLPSVVITDVTDQEELKQPLVCICGAGASRSHDGEIERSSFPHKRALKKFKRLESPSTSSSNISLNEVDSPMEQIKNYEVELQNEYYEDDILSLMDNVTSNDASLQTRIDNLTLENDELTWRLEKNVGLLAEQASSHYNEMKALQNSLEETKQLLASVKIENIELSGLTTINTELNLKYNVLQSTHDETLRNLEKCHSVSKTKEKECQENISKLQTELNLLQRSHIVKQNEITQQSYNTKHQNEKYEEERKNHEELKKSYDEIKAHNTQLKFENSANTEKIELLQTSQKISQDSLDLCRNQKDEMSKQIIELKDIRLNLNDKYTEMVEKYDKELEDYFTEIKLLSNAIKKLFKDLFPQIPYPSSDIQAMHKIGVTTMEYYTDDAKILNLVNSHLHKFRTNSFQAVSDYIQMNETLYQLIKTELEPYITFIDNKKETILTEILMFIKKIIRYYMNVFKELNAPFSLALNESIKDIDKIYEYLKDAIKEAISIKRKMSEREAISIKRKMSDTPADPEDTITSAKRKRAETDLAVDLVWSFNRLLIFKYYEILYIYVYNKKYSAIDISPFISDVVNLKEKVSQITSEWDVMNAYKVFILNQINLVDSIMKDIHFRPVDISEPESVHNSFRLLENELKTYLNERMDMEINK